MADSGPEDLVSNVKIEGTEQTAAELESMGKRGAAAFDDIAAAADRADKQIGGATGGVKKNAFEAADALASINKKGKIDPSIAKNLKDVERAGFNLGASIRTVAPQIGSFAARLVALATGAAAAATGLAVAAVKISKSVSGTADALGDQTKAQQAANDRSLDGETALIQQNAALRALYTSAQRGEMSWSDYGAAVRKSNEDFRESRRVANELANAQDRTREANERLAKQAANTQAYAKLTDALGGPLASAMTQFGTSLEQTRRGLTTTFSPAIAGVIDVISSALSKNASGIAAFAEKAATSISTFVEQNGPAIQKALENIGRLAGGVFQGLIDAAPGILDFFNNVLVPAIDKLVGAFQTVADIINSTFGTRITAGFLILSVVIAQLSGSIILFFGLLRTGGAIIGVLTTVATALNIPLLALIGIIAAVVAGFYLLMQVDWTSLLTNAQAVGTAILTFFTSLPGKIIALFKTMWDGIVAGGTAIVQLIIDAWNGLVAFFTGLPASVVAIFVQVWEGVKAATVAAFDAMKQTVLSWVESVKAYIQPLLDLIKKVGDALGSVDASGGGGSTQGFAGGGHVKGAGTSTSDSILARLSHGEFVMKAKSVAKYGLGLLQAINSGKLDLNRMAAFAAGGLVDGMRGNAAPKLAFAEGGQVNARALRPLSLTIEGQTFDGLLMPEDVAGKLTKFAVGRQTSSAGRKPQWVGGRR